MISALFALGLLLLVGFVFNPVLTAGFVSDSDHGYVPNRAWMWAGTWDWSHVARFFDRNWVYSPEETGGYYQPLVALSLRLDGWLARTASSQLDASATVGWYSRAFQFHLTNLCLHVANVGLVFFIVWRLTRSHLWSLLLAALFAFHPTQVESVAWISQRMTLLGGFFSLLAICTYLQARVSRTAWAWMTLTTLCFAGALLCRPQFIALPVVLLVLDLWPLKRSGWRPLLEKLPLFVVMGFSAVIQSQARSSAALPRVPGAGGIELVLHELASLMSRLVLPVGLGPYQPPSATVGGLALGGVFDVLLIAVAVAGAVVAMRWSRPIFVAIAGSGLLILPALLEAPYARLLLSDQFLYLGLVIPIIAAAAWMGSRPEFRKQFAGRWAAILTACAVTAGAVHSYAQTMYWQSAVSLAQLTIAQHPDWVHGKVALVEAYIQENEFDAALLAAERAASGSPEDPSIQFYLGTVLLLSDSSRASEAIEPLQQALESNPNWIQCLQNLGVALARSERSREAIPFLERARDLEPASAGIRLGLGHAYLEVHRFASARREFQEALRRRNDPMAHLGLAIAWAANDEVDYARRHLEAAVAKDPGFAERAGRSPELMKLKDVPGFGHLISTPGEGAASVAPATESPAATRAFGS